MSGYMKLREIELGPHHVSTGRTVHKRGSSVLPPPSKLAIAKYTDEEGYYLLYLDKQGEELTDTFHESLDDAIAQAQWEFGVTANEWTVLG